MVDFNIDVGGPVSGRVSVKAPVTDNSKLAKLNGVNNVLKGLFSAVPSSEDRKKLGNERSLANYQNELLSLSDAVDQKRLTPEGARTKARALHSSFISNNPGLTEKATTLHSKTLSTAGLGENITKENTVDAAEEKLLGEAVDGGFVYSTMNEEEVQEGLFKYRQYKRSMQDIDDTSKRIGLASSRVGLSKSEIALREAEDKEQATKKLDGVADGVRFQIRSKLSDIRKRVGAGLPVEQALTELADNEAQWKFEVSSMARASGNENINAIMNPISQMYEVLRKEISGEMSKEVSANKLAYLQSGIQTGLLDDPEMQTLYGIGKILPNTDMSLYMASQAKVNEYMKTNSLKIDVTPYNIWDNNIRDGAVFRKSVTSILKDGVRKNSNLKGEDKTAHTEQMNNTIHNMLKGIDVYKDAVDDPKKFNEVVDFIASPEFSKWQGANKLDQETADKAALVLQQQYSRKALPVIEELWRNPSFSGSDMRVVQEQIKNGTSIQSMMKIKFSEGGIKFIAGTDDKAHVALSNTFNREIAPIVNKLVRSTAHLEGHSKYEDVYQQNFAQMFDDKKDFEGDGKTGISDFQKGELKKGLDQQTSEILDVIGRAEGTDKGDGYNETLGFGKFTNGDVKLTSMTLDEVQDLQADMLKHPDNEFNSSAVGRYQIVGTTLKGLMKSLGLKGSDKFDEDTQDRLALALLEGRGLSKVKEGKMSKAKFIDNLSKEWASLPNTSGSGTYEGQRTGVDIAKLEELVDSLLA